MVNVIQNVLDMFGYFGDAAGAFPLSSLLLLFGFLFIAFSSLFLGYLALGAAVDFILPDSLGRRPPQRG